MNPNQTEIDNEILERTPIRALLDEGVTTGRVSYNQVLEALGEDAVDDEAVEEVLEAFESRRIQIVEDDELKRTLSPFNAAKAPTIADPKAAPASTSRASTPPASTLEGSTPEASEAREAPEGAAQGRRAHADLDEVLAAIDRMSALPDSLHNIASIEDNLSDEAADGEGPAVADAFKQYLDRVAETPLLSQGEERELAVKVRDKSWDADAARQKLVESNLRLVVFMSRKYEERTTLPILDIVQEATIGLLRAIDRFDPARGHRLATYATWWIRQSINRAIADQGRSMKLPAQLSQAIMKLQKLQRALSQEHGRSPSRQELATASGMSVLQVEEALRAAQSMLSLEAPVGGDEDFELGESLQGGEGNEPASNLTRSELKREVEEVLESLSERERLILEKRFGMGDFQSTGPQTLEDVAAQLNLSRERVRQLEIRALRKLRRRSGRLRDDDDDLD